MTNRNVITSAAFLLLDENGTGCFQRRAPDDGGPGVAGLVEVPGGKPQRRETMAETAKREALEELGVNLDPCALARGPAVFARVDLPIRLGIYCYVVRPDAWEGVTQPRVGQTITWLSQPAFRRHPARDLTPGTLALRKMLLPFME